MSWDARNIPEERLSSIDEDGKRAFLYPAKVKGKYKSWRNIFYFVLLIIFLVVPWTSFDGEQTLLFDISNRRFVFFGSVFSAHDGPFIFFPLILATLGLGFVTTVWGRIWCGWACPQTVFLEFIFRRIDQWVEGSHVQRMKLDRGPWNFEKIRKKALKWFLFLFVCSHMAHSFTAYFVGAKSLFWVTASSPLGHWGLFLFVQVLTLILLFNFGWFREQFCIVMCPYGRFQSVLMGQRSLAVIYDEKRGEPRRGKDEGDGDCVDCFKCVSVCPTGIDIRRGMQMECIACTACIDACDEVMDKVKKPRGLIRYTNLLSLKKGQETRRWGMRSRVYFGVIVLLSSVFVFMLSSRKDVDIKILRAIEAPYTVTGEQIINHFRLVVKNQAKTPLKLKELSVKGVSVVSPELPVELKPGELKRIHFFVHAKLKELSLSQSSRELRLTLEREGEIRSELKDFMLLRP